MSAVEDIDDALIGLRRLWAHSGNFHDPTVGQVDLSTVLVCREIAVLDREVSVADIAAGLDVAHSTASRLVERAERSGAVRRVRSNHDGRRISVELTGTGKRLHETASGFRIDYLRGLLGDWNQEDLDHFARLLRRFAERAHDHPIGETL